jgi:hypothetical protein
LDNDRSVQAELVADEPYILGTRHLPSQHLSWVTGEHPKHEEKEKRYPEQDRNC